MMGIVGPGHGLEWLHKVYIIVQVHQASSSEHEL